MAIICIIKGKFVHLALGPEMVDEQHVVAKTPLGRVAESQQVRDCVVLQSFR